MVSELTKLRVQGIFGLLFLIFSVVTLIIVYVSLTHSNITNEKLYQLKYEVVSIGNDINDEKNSSYNLNKKFEKINDNYNILEDNLDNLTQNLETNNEDISKLNEDISKKEEEIRLLNEEIKSLEKQIN